MKKSGCIVKTADSGKKALEIFENEPNFDLIFMDIQMPEMDGIETTQALRKRFENLPTIVAMTAYSMQHDREKFLAAGMDDYLAKTIRAAVLIQNVSSIIEAQRKRGANEQRNKEIDEKQKANNQQPVAKIFDFAIINQLKEMVGAEMVLSVFQDFEAEAREQIMNTKNAYPDDVKTIQRELHTLKGNSGTIGLTRLHDITEIIEVPAKIGDLSNFEKNIKILEAEFEAFVENYPKTFNF